MAEQVQSILERMVAPLKDLRTRGIFTNDEIQKIVERRRRSEYALQRRGGSALLSDYLRYIEDEINLEKLRKLRKEKVISMMREEGRRERRRRRDMAEKGEDDDNDDYYDGGREGKTVRNHAYKTSGPGDSHIVSHVHFLYQRTLRKFHYPLDVLLNYANFARECKSFHVLSRIYAEGLQHHPREAGLWIEAASFEYFGYVAQDYHNEGGEDGAINSKVVGSSIRNARVLMQRGLRINGTSAELWLQYFALELHYVQKLRGRREILDGGGGHEEGKEEEEGDNAEEGSSSLLLPARIILKNAVKAIPHDVTFRLRFVEACRAFPHTASLEEYVMEGIARDFGNSVDGWVARITFAEERMRKKSGTHASGDGGDGEVAGFLGELDDNDGTNDVDRHPRKKARDWKIRSRDRDRTRMAIRPALTQLLKSLEIVPTQRMYLEGARFLRMRIHHLNDGTDADVDREEGKDDKEDTSYLLGMKEDAVGALRRHAALLEELYEGAKRKGISSTALILDQVEYLLSVEDGLRKAEVLLSEAVTSSATKEVDDDARLWLRWSEISQQIMESSSSSPGDALTTATSSPACILRRALKRIPLHHRRAHASISTELMHRLMLQPASPKIVDELRLMFQELILLSQGSECSMSYVKRMKRDDASDDGNDEENGGKTRVNVASSILAYLKYTMDNNSSRSNAEDINAVRSIYTCALYRSSYGKSCSGKTYDELISMKAFFDVCIRYEIDHHRGRKTNSSVFVNSNKKEGGLDDKKAWKTRVMKLYETAIEFYRSGGSDWRKVVNRYQRDRDNFIYGH